MLIQCCEISAFFLDC